MIKKSTKIKKINDFFCLSAAMKEKYVVITKNFSANTFFVKKTPVIAYMPTPYVLRAPSFTAPLFRARFAIRQTYSGFQPVHAPSISMDA